MPPEGGLDVDLVRAAADGTDFAELLGVTKWVPPVPPTMSGEVESAPGLLPWVDIENLQRHPGIFSPGEPVVVTEKLHGTACLLTYSVQDDRVYVSSKGFGAKSLALTEDPRNLYWRAVRGHGVAEAAAELAARLGATRVGVFGEVYGEGVQDLSYGADGRRDTLGYAVFDVSAEIDGQVRWLDAAELLEGRLPLVPRLWAGPYDSDRVLELAGGRETVSGRELHIREGVVVRPVTELGEREVGDGGEGGRCVGWALGRRRSPRGAGVSRTTGARVPARRSDRVGEPPGRGALPAGGGAQDVQRLLVPDAADAVEQLFLGLVMDVERGRAMPARPAMSRVVVAW
ncbi:hypothetical protein SALBM217S_05040 [Streptomyces griseoloalbus]